MMSGRGQLDIGAEASVRDHFAGLGPIDHLVVTAAFVRPGPFRGGDIAAARLSMEGLVPVTMRPPCPGEPVNPAIRWRLQPAAGEERCRSSPP